MTPKAAQAPARILEFEATDEEVLAWYLRGVLEKVRWNQSEAQRILEIHRSTVRRRMAKLGLAPAPLRRAARARAAARGAAAETS